MAKQSWLALAGVNRKRMAIHVRYAALQIVSEFGWQARCPFCGGILPVTRGNGSRRILTADVCTLCGQRVIYDDVVEMRARDGKP